MIVPKKHHAETMCGPSRSEGPAYHAEVSKYRKGKAIRANVVRIHLEEKENCQSRLCCCGSKCFDRRPLLMVSISDSVKVKRLDIAIIGRPRLIIVFSWSISTSHRFWTSKLIAAMRARHALHGGRHKVTLGGSEAVVVGSGGITVGNVAAEAMTTFESTLPITAGVADRGSSKTTLWPGLGSTTRPLGPRWWLCSTALGPIDRLSSSNVFLNLSTNGWDARSSHFGWFLGIESLILLGLLLRWLLRLRTQRHPHTVAIPHRLTVVCNAGGPRRWNSDDWRDGS